MEALNHTLVNEFILLGLTDNFELQVLIFAIFTLVYFFTLLGNILFSILIWTDPHLQTPMYFFLSNLSCVDILYSTSVTPKLLAILVSYRTISFSGCVAQLFGFTFFGLCECNLLAVMAYDRYVAICNPLLYRAIINQRTCASLVCAAYFWSALNGVTQTVYTFCLSFCRSNVIDHFFCDYLPLLKLSCSDTSTNKLLIFLSAVCVGLVTCGVIMTSYWYIINTILKIQSVNGRLKAFSTCASHITVVSMFYGAIFIMYLHPPQSSMTQNKVVSLFYTVVIPMLNPMIYSLRNEEVKKSFRKMLS